MATILLIGEDASLLEGLAQMLSSAGHSGWIARTASEALESAAGRQPLAVVADRELALGEPEIFRLPISSGGALLLYRSTDVEPTTLPPALQRMVLAELTLPLERKRLLALIQHVDERARATGRKNSAPPEQRAP